VRGSGSVGGLQWSMGRSSKMTREAGYMKPDNGNAHTLSVGAGIFKEVIICKTSISQFQVLAQHVLAQFALFPKLSS
jgi:hypothetical protein